MAKKKATTKKTAKKKRRIRRRQHPVGLKDPLIFIDTNILLDFYRARTDQSFALLERIQGIQDQAIATYQVEMEFKKNRQAAIKEALNNLKALQKITCPSFLRGSQILKTAQKRLRESDQRVTKLRGRIEEALHNPTQRDPVYQAAQRLFASTGNHNLNRCNEALYKERYRIRRDAFKRFILGYPPRKRADTAIGDAVNWEWIVRCAKPDKRDVVIVSRDSDYGVTIGKESYINDWLLTEFRARVSKQGQVKLTARLSMALKWLEVPVTPGEVEGEEELIESARKERAAKGLWAGSAALESIIAALPPVTDVMTTTFLQNLMRWSAERKGNGGKPEDVSD